MKTVRGKTFTGQRVVLDGKSFVECHFKDASLIIEGTGGCVMPRRRREESCRMAVAGPAQLRLQGPKMMLCSGGGVSRVSDNATHTVRWPRGSRGKKKASGT